MMSSENIYSEDNSFRVQQILLGLEEIYPEELLLPKLRFFLEKIVEESYSQELLIKDFFEVIKLTGDYPVCLDLSLLLEEKNPKQILINLLRLLEHFSYNPVYKNLKVLVKFLDLKEHSFLEIFHVLVQELLAVFFFENAIVSKTFHNQ